MPARTSRIGKALVRAAVVAAGIMIGVSSARAGYTTINPPPSAPVAEKTQQQIFNQVYGSGFTLQGDGVSYSNGAITATRINDTGSPNDQIWSGTVTNATAEAVWAGYQQTFGYYPNSSGGSFTPLFTANGTESFSVTGSVSNPSLPATFRFGSSNQAGADSSLPSDNFDGKDHMISYQITGLGGNTPTYMLFFEDRGNTGSNPDFDFNDLVVQLQTSPSSVPEPGTLMVVAGGALLLIKRPRIIKA